MPGTHGGPVAISSSTPTTVATTVATHVVHVVPAGRGCRGHWQAVCVCGWYSPSYMRAHAADAMAQDHQQAPTTPTGTTPATTPTGTTPATTAPITPVPTGTTAMGPELAALVALSRDQGVTAAERVAAARQAANVLVASGCSVLEVYPLGLPELEWQDDDRGPEWGPDE